MFVSRQNNHLHIWHVSCAVVGVLLLDLFCTFHSHSHLRLPHCSLHMEMTTATIHDTERRLVNWLNRTCLHQTEDKRPRGKSSKRSHTKINDVTTEQTQFAQGRKRAGARNSVHTVCCSAPHKRMPETLCTTLDHADQQSDPF